MLTRMLLPRVARSLSSVYLMMVMIILLMCSCRNEDEPAPPEAEFLISSRELRSFNTGEMNTALGQMQIKAFDPFINNPIQIFRIVYQTMLFGEEVEASGLVVVPLFVEDAPIVSAQHFIITEDSEVPSELLVIDGSFGLLELISANGFITFIPDYIGFGASRERLHPFYLEEPSVQATVDLLKAGQEFLNQQEISYSNELFLFGYSEGGYVTLATQKAIETNTSVNTGGLNLQAVSAGAGGYVLDVTLELIVAEENYPAPAFPAFLYLAYQNYVEQVSQPLSSVFQPPFAERIPLFFNGQNSFNTINKELPTDLSALFTLSFLEELRSPTSNAFEIALSENSVADFAPQAPLRLYHSQSDEIIPPATTFITADSLQAQGATSVEVVTLNAGSHFKAATKITALTIDWFTSLK
jgi:pimeloyl-ACP methyl ester carboxylesterase